MKCSRRLLLAVLAGLAVVLVVAAPASAAGEFSSGAEHGSSATVCTKYASPTGSDANAGTLASPYATVQKLSDSLASGQVGCLRAGSYGTGVQTTFRNAGATITAYPGEAVTLHGFPDIVASSVHLSYLNIDLDLIRTDGFTHLCAGDTNVDNALEIDGTSNVVIEHNNISEAGVATQYRTVAVGAGWNASNGNLTIRYNRVHDAGHCGEEDHGIYLNKDTSPQVYGNWLYSLPSGTGVQLYASSSPGPTDGHLYANVIDQASSCFVTGGNDSTTARNLLEHNVCTNTVGHVTGGGLLCSAGSCTGPDPGVLNFDWWGGGVGSGNTLQNNDVYCASGFTHCTTADGSSGMTVTGTITSNPQFADANYATSHDYRVSSGSPAASWGLWDGDLGGGGPPLAAPSVPTGLTATGGNATVTLNWAANPTGENVTRYDVWRTDQAAVWGCTIATGCEVGPTTFYNSSSVVNGTQYCYQIAAVNATGSSAKTAQACATPHAPGPPSTPTGVAVAAQAGHVMKVTWTANASADNVTRYDVWRTDTTSTWGCTIATGCETGPTTFFNSNLVTPGTQYCYQVAAVNTTGSSSKTSQVCAVAIS